MKIRYRFIALVLSLSLVLAIGLSACSDNSGSSSTDSDTASGSDLEIGVVVKTLGNPLFREVAYGAVEMGKKLGVSVNVQATSKEGEIEEQIRICEDLISGGVDGLVVTPQHSDGIAPAVDVAHDAGIPFIAVDTDVNSAEVDSFVGVDNVNAGYVIATMVIEAMGGEGDIVILEGMAGASTSEDRADGFRKAIAEYPDVNIVADQNADYQQDIAQQKMSDILQTEKNVKGVLACGALMALGAITSLEEEGYTFGGTDGVNIGTADIGTAALEAVRDGQIQALAYHWGKLYGAWGVEMAVRSANGEEIPAVIQSPQTEITIDNYAGFLDYTQNILDNYTFQGE